MRARWPRAGSSSGPRRHRRGPDLPHLARRHFPALVVSEADIEEGHRAAAGSQPARILLQRADVLIGDAAAAVERAEHDDVLGVALAHGHGRVGDDPGWRLAALLEVHDVAGLREGQGGGDRLTRDRVPEHHEAADPIDIGQGQPGIPDRRAARLGSQVQHTAARLLREPGKADPGYRCIAVHHSADATHRAGARSTVESGNVACVNN